MTKITKIKALEVLDSRGNPTIKVILFSDTTKASAIVPSGASTGKKEALELRDNDPKRYHGKGAQKAIENVLQVIGPEITNKTWNSQQELDQFLLDLDGTENKSKLGANAILGVSLAFYKLSKKLESKPYYDNGFTLPVPMMNVINGGKHADSGLAIQEFMILPIGAKTFKQAVRMGSEIFHTLKKLLVADGEKIAVGDEGGFAPNIETCDKAFEYISKAVTESGYKLGEEIVFGIDAAADSFFKDGKYFIDSEYLTSDELIEYYKNLIDKYPLVSLEDPFSEDDKPAWQKFNEQYGQKIQIVGDDLLVTNPKIIKQAIEDKLCNSSLIKVNQIGTLYETIEAIETSKENGWTTVISHRSGDTEDSFIADLSVYQNTGLIKTGSLSRSERTCKYNRLLEIEDELGEKAKYLGPKAVKNLLE